jgi:SAM-dependent methyltransferase
MASRRLGLLLAFAFVGFGIAATVFWLTLPDDIVNLARGNPGPLFLSLILLVLLTSANLAIRWVRWHYLLRRLDLNLRAKDSLTVWSVTLPAIATPFYLGELSRAVLLSRQYPGSARSIAGAWVVERITDALVIGGLVLAAQSRWQILAIVVGLGVTSALALHLSSSSRSIRALTRPTVIGLAVVSALLAWVLPIIGLWSVLGILQTSISTASVISAFGIGTLAGGLTGIPLGVGVTGSTMILVLQAQEVGLEASALAAAVFRAGTAWYALCLGVVALLRFRHRLASLLNLREQSDHFELIALGYDQNIPEHLKDRLLLRKTEAMQDWLEKAGAEQAWLGLDIGCGHGWYAGEMAGEGFSMSACDLSPGQVQQAARNLRSEEATVQLCVADAASLPYPDRFFDFTYAVNVIHHLPSGGSLSNVISEIVRNLKPGGLFFLHEINTQNPLFRFYMGYVFPLLRDIDEGTESWVMPGLLPPVEGAHWKAEVKYFSFLPDFAPRYLVRWLSGIERLLEGSFLKTWSSHYVACLVKD